MAKKAAKPKFSGGKTTIDRSGPVLRSNRMFVQLKAIGECDDNGRSVCSFGYGKRMIAEIDKPLRSVVIPVILEMMRFAHWTSDDAAQEDLKALKAIVDDFEIRKPGEESLAG